MVTPGQRERNAGVTDNINDVGHDSEQHEETREQTHLKGALVSSVTPVSVESKCLCLLNRYSVTL